MSVVGAAVALLLSRSALRPLAHVLEIAEQVTASGDLSARVPEPRGGSEVARLGHTFNAMLTRLSAFRERETEFTRHASHELRTPITAMRAQLDANKHGWVTDAEVLQTASEQVDRLSRLTSALLLLSRENRTDLAHFDLAGCVTKMAEQHGADYRGPVSLMVLGNETLITQALENLLRNAHRHAPGSQVRVVLAETGRSVQLSVTDDGPGVSPEDLAHLGEAFYRAAGITVPGSGLGLAVVQRVAEVHGGQVRFALVEPHGLSVTMTMLERQSRSIP
jgi:signal transduction histidine kinase